MLLLDTDVCLVAPVVIPSPAVATDAAIASTPSPVSVSAPLLAERGRSWSFEASSSCEQLYDGEFSRRDCLTRLATGAAVLGGLEADRFTVDNAAAAAAPDITGPSVNAKALSSTRLPDSLQFSSHSGLTTVIPNIVAAASRFSVAFDQIKCVQFSPNVFDTVAPNERRSLVLAVVASVPSSFVVSTYATTPTSGSFAFFIFLDGIFTFKIDTKSMK